MSSPPDPPDAPDMADRPDLSDVPDPAGGAPAGTRPYAQLMSGLAVYFVIGAVAKAVQLAVTIVFLRILTPEEFGVQAVVLLNEQVLIIVAGYAFTNPIGRYFVEARREGGDGGDVVGTALFAMVAVAVVVAAVWQLLAVPISHLTLGDSPDRVAVTRLVGVSFLANLVIGLVTAVWQLERRYVAFAVASIGQYVAFAAFGLVFVGGLDLGAAGMVAGWVAASALVAIGVAIAIVAELRLAYTRPRLSQLLHYGGPLVPAALVMILLTGNDRYLLARIDSLAAVGVYAAVLTVVFGLNTAVVTPFKRIWFSLVWQLRHDEREHEFHRRVLTWYATAQVLAVVVLAVFGDLVMTAVGGHDYAWAGGALAVVYGGLAVFGAADILSMGYFFYDRTILYTVTVCISTVVAVAWNLVLIERWGLWAAAWSNPVSYAVFAALSLLFAQRFFRPGFAWGRLVQLGVLASAATAGGLGVRTLGGSFGVIGAVLVVAALVAALRVTGIISGEDLQSLRRLGRRWRAAATRRMAVS